MTSQRLACHAQDYTFTQRSMNMALAWKAPTLQPDVGTRLALQTTHSVFRSGEHLATFARPELRCRTHHQQTPG